MPIGTGINIITNFDVNATKPIDSRMIASDSAERVGFLWKYDGLKVFQLDTRKGWIWNSGLSDWELDASGSATGDFWQKIEVDVGGDNYNFLHPTTADDLVAIGTISSSPTYRLSVSGNVSISGNLNVTNSITSGYLISASAFESNGNLGLTQDQNNWTVPIVKVNGGLVTALTELNVSSITSGLDQYWQRDGTNSYLKSLFANDSIALDDEATLGWGSGIGFGDTRIKGQDGQYINIFVDDNSGIEIDNKGNVGVGTTPAGDYKLEVNGEFSAIAKSFVIDHPTKKGKLRYGSLESPYYGIRLTGRGEIIINKRETKIKLPDYISHLVDKDGINIQLTNYNHCRIIFIKEINLNNNHFIVKSKFNIIDFLFKRKKKLSFFWTFTAIRKDVKKLKVEDG